MKHCSFSSAIGALCLLLIAIAPPQRTEAKPPPPTSYRGYAYFTQLARLSADEISRLSEEVRTTLARDGWVQTERGLERTRRIDQGSLRRNTGITLRFFVGGLWINISEHGSIASKKIPRHAEHAEIWYGLGKSRIFNRLRRNDLNCLILHRKDSLSDIEIVSTVGGTQADQLLSFMVNDCYWAWARSGFCLPATKPAATSQEVLIAKE